MSEEFISEKDSDGSPVFYVQEKLHGQVMFMAFGECYSTKDKAVFNVEFRISEKRKKYFDNTITLKSTGKIGLEGLLWAKNKILPFVEHVKGKYSGKAIVILVRWDDNRRRTVYARGLKSLGFYFKSISVDKTKSKKFLYRKFI